LSYAADIWEMFGVNVLDIWDLPADYFFSMTTQVDAARREAQKHKRG